MIDQKRIRWRKYSFKAQQLMEPYKYTSAMFKKFSIKDINEVAEHCHDLVAKIPASIWDCTRPDSLLTAARFYYALVSHTNAKKKTKAYYRSLLK